MRLTKFRRRINEHRRNLAWGQRWYPEYCDICQYAHALSQETFIFIQGSQVLETLASRSMDRASDERMLLKSLNHVNKRSGGTLGPRESVPLKSWDKKTRLLACRMYRDIIRDGSYQPGPTRPIHLKKFPSGKRTIRVADADDRIVAKAAQLTLDPFIDPMLTECCFGYRVGYSRFQAMAACERYLCDGYTSLVAVDIRKAFDRIPHAPLREILRSTIPSENFVAYLEKLLSLGAGRGIPQGNALSPLMLNLYLDRRLDRPWVEKNAAWPMIRYADDILIMTRSRSDALQALQKINRLVLSADLTLKDKTSDRVATLCEGEGLDWLGHSLKMDDDKVAFSLRQDEAQRLGSRLVEWNSRKYSRQEKTRRLLAWARSRGPAYSPKRRRHLFVVIKEASRIAGIDVNVKSNRVMRHWKIGHDHWQEIRSRHFIAS